VSGQRYERDTVRTIAYCEVMIDKDFFIQDIYLNVIYEI